MANPSLAMIPSGYKAGKLYSVLPQDGTGDFTVSRNSVATRVNKEGLIEEMGVNVPRLDYSDGGCPVLLTEPQSTNYHTYSEPSSLPAGYGGLGVTYESYSWANGFTNAVVFGDNSTDRYYNGTNGVAGVEMVQSAYVIMDDLGEPVVGNSTTTGDFNFIMSGSGNTTPLPNVYVGNNIWRVSAKKTFTTTTHTNGIRKQTTQSNRGFKVVGWQLEQLSYPTSYIKTEGTTATRLADVVTVDTTGITGGVSEIIETIDGVEQTPITTIPSTYQVPNGNINKIIMNP
jgi:hypothetical protein